MTQLKRFVQWFKSLAAPSIAPTTESASSLEFDPAWHGDHWQNLLSSPMDARRYVMEDWSIPFNGDIVTEEADTSREKATV